MAAANDSQTPKGAQVVHFTKHTFAESDVPRRIKKVEFSVMPPSDIIKNGEFQPYDARLYQLPSRTPAPNGVLDPRLGVSNKSSKCQTCNQSLADCTGHFGFIKLEMPVFHIGYFRSVLQILCCICKTCSAVLLDEDIAERYRRAYRRPGLDSLGRAGILRRVADLCKRTRHCFRCGAYNGNVRKVTGALKITHERWKKEKDKVTRSDKIPQALRAEFAAAVQSNEQIEQHLGKVADDLNPIRVLQLFQAMSGLDCQLLDLRGRPEDLLMTVLPVPPLAIRPSVEMDAGAGSNEDDITVTVKQILELNTQMRSALDKGVRLEGGSGLMELWDFLQLKCASYINSDLPGLGQTHSQPPGKPLRGFVQRLKGKQGRFRGNLSGKRVDYTARTVISPDPNLRVDEVCIPRAVAMTLSYPERVTPHNIDKLRHRVSNGANTWPGANILQLQDGSKFVLRAGALRRAADELHIGDIVQRHLEDGDVVLFNRQPSLHRISIMAHRVRVRDGRTFRFNECVCTPYNADFDGDEMNVHVPQTEEARAEAATLMGVFGNLCTPKNGDIIIAATQDFLTTAFLVTSKDVFYSRSAFCQLVGYFGDACEAVDLPTPAILKPLELWTGKQLFSMLVRPNAATRILVNLETIEKKNYTKGRGHMCPSDGFVCFRNSELLTGRLGKATLGDGNKDGLFHVLNSDFSAQAAAQCMNRLAKLSARFIGDRGFSIGIDDVTPAPALQRAKEHLMEAGHAEADRLIAALKAGKLPLQAGMTMDASLEAQIQGLLSGIRSSAGEECMRTLAPHNSPLIMSQCGSKGSPVNIAQMVACVGQQVVNGQRTPNGFKDRSLPHFPRGDRTPEGKGFVVNSFYSGLSPTEFFFHTMAGREGLVDTAVKTAETGYMSRRLMKSLEDLFTHYDGTVRNTANGIVQLTYGDDGLDPLLMEGDAKGRPLHLPRCLAVLRATCPRPTDDLALLPDELTKAATDAMLAAALVDPDPDKVLGVLGSENSVSTAFIADLRAFLDDLAHGATAARARLGLERNVHGPAVMERAAGVDGLTAVELSRFVDLCKQLYDDKRVDPGATVGAVGAQSIGEPGTQMTLKTFHFAGVAAMNVTLGVPRIKEIINATKNISTPIITVALINDASELATRMVKAQLEKTLLGTLCSSMSLVVRPGGACVDIALDLPLIERLQLRIDPHLVRLAIVAHRKLKLAWEQVSVVSKDRLQVRASPAKGRADLGFPLQSLLTRLPEVVVHGIPTVQRAVINRQTDGRFQLFAEGTDLRAVMCKPGVEGTRTQTNHVMETWEVLGIEAARGKIIEQIDTTMASHGMAIDPRHTMLLADCMTYKGEVLGITRFGIAKMKDSVLMLASFEKTTEHLFDAALHGRVDSIDGVSEAIIMGAPMPSGTGLFQLQQRPLEQQQESFEPRPDPVLLSL